MKRMAISSVWSSFARGRNEFIVRDVSARFDALYQQNYHTILAFLRFLVGTPEVAEDLTALVFEKALTHLTDVHSSDAISPWLFRIARNCATDYFRRYKPILSLEQLVIAEHPQTYTLEEIAIAREEQRQLIALLSKLSEREREILGLKFVVGLHNREIAHILQISEGTVGSSLHRVLRRLRAALRGEGE